MLHRFTNQFLHVRHVILLRVTDKEVVKGLFWLLKALLFINLGENGHNWYNRSRDLLQQLNKFLIEDIHYYRSVCYQIQGIEHYNLDSSQVMI